MPNRRFPASLLLMVAFALGCRAQAPAASAQQDRLIENSIRQHYQEKLPPSVEITVGPRKPSDISGWDTVTVNFKNSQQTQSIDFLLSKDGKTLAQMNKFEVSDPSSKFDVTGRPVRGNKDAKVTIVNFDDFECPFCARMHQTLTNQVLKTYGDKVRIIYKDFPLTSIHPWSMRAAVDSNCLGSQSSDAYWAFADYIHSHQSDVTYGATPKPAKPGERPQPLDLNSQFAAVDKITTDTGGTFRLDQAKLQSCIKAQDETQVKQSIAQGTSLDIDATPTLFVNGERVPGALPFDYFQLVLDRALRDAGVAPPPHPAETSSAVPPPPPAASTPAVNPQVSKK